MLVALRFATITADHAGQRIDNYLFNVLKGVPKSRVYRLLRKGEVRVNKKRMKPEYKLQVGDEVRIPPVKLDTEESKAQPGKALQLRLAHSIIYEDDDIIVINKPAGVPVHGGSGVDYGVIDAIRLSRPKNTMLELVHRLDRDTSGCLLLAKTRPALTYLHELFRSTQLDKCYLAMVHGHWPDNLGVIDQPLYKNQLRSGERRVEVRADGKSAQTHFKVLHRYSQWTLLEVSPQTGRTHQIRVHAAFAGFPLVGDKKYGDLKLDKQVPLNGGKQLFLHAASLTFKLPPHGHEVTVRADLESEQQKLLDMLGEEVGLVSHENDELPETY